jgi:hypothetical protein
MLIYFFFTFPLLKTYLTKTETPMYLIGIRTGMQIIEIHVYDY